MKSGGRRAADSSAASGSSLAAHAAIANIKDIGRRRDRGQEVDVELMAKKSRGDDPLAQASPPPPTIAKRRLSLWAVAGGGATLGLVLIAFWMMSLSWSRYSVAGTVQLNRKPLANAEILFHPSGSSLAVPQGKSLNDGSFRVTGLAAGSYKVTLRAPEGAEATVPMIYTQTESTPLRLNVRRNLRNVSMHAVQTKRQ